MSPIPAIIIEDEQLSLGTLLNLLRDYVPEVEIIGTASNVRDGIQLLQRRNPKLVFLDIAMPDGDGFDILKEFPNPDFQVIFTTAYEEYAIRAFDFSASSYLLKPISSEDLQKAVYQYIRQAQQTEQKMRMKILQESMQQQYQRIALPTTNGLNFVEIEDIIYCQAEGSYTEFHLKDGNKVVVSNGLSHYEKLLQHIFFYRIHHKYLVNLRQISRYVKGSGGYVLLENGTHLDVSVRRKEGFLEAMRMAM